MLGVSPLTFKVALDPQVVYIDLGCHPDCWVFLLCNERPAVCPVVSTLTFLPTSPRFCSDLDVSLVHGRPALTSAVFINPKCVCVNQRCLLGVFTLEQISDPSVFALIGKRVSFPGVSALTNHVLLASPVPQH